MRTEATAAARLAALALAALLSAGAPARAEPPMEGSPDCGIPAFVDEGDGAMTLAYRNGLMTGLEKANLPRVCLRRPDRDDDESWAKVAATVSAESPPVVFAFGRRSIARVAAAPFLRGRERIPCVYVDVIATVGGTPSVPDPEPAAPAAVVRAHVTVEAWGKALRALLPGRPSLTVLLPWTAETPEAAAWRRAAASAAGLDLRTRRDTPPVVDAILDLPAHLGETAEDFEATRREAHALRLPLLSADPGKFPKGAAVALVPDCALLGRVAAEAGRRLAGGEGAGQPLKVVVRATRTLVDLDAADAEGLKPPLPFLAAADLLRKVSPPEGGP